jgi:long-chain fatty acid transport protein
MMKIKLNLMTKKNRSKKCAHRALFLFALAIFSAANSYAEGFRNPPPGAFDLGRAGGRIAQVDDSSAVQQNPANLVDITNLEAQLTPSVVYISVDYHSASGDSANTRNPCKLLPNFFVSLPLKNDRFAAGLGVTVPYGLSMDWDRNASAFADPAGWRYQSPYYAALTTINFNPTVAYRLNDELSIGVGLDIMWSQLTIKQFYPSAFFGGAADSNLKAEGDGFGYGGNLGITWKITDHQRVAVTYRSQMDVNQQGDFRISNLAPGSAGLGATPQSDFGAVMKYPNIVAIGYGIELTDKIRLESDIEWVQFSRFKSLDLNLGNNSVLFSSLGKSTSIAENWHDTFTAGFSGDWKFAEHWVARGGYQFYETPVPDSTFSPTIPDANQNVITVGLGWKGRHTSLEFAYGLDFYNDRNINSDQTPAFNGKYTFNVHLFSLAYRYAF